MMNTRTFYYQLVGLAAVVAGMIALLQLTHPAFVVHQSLSWASWLFFVVFSALLFRVGERLSKHENPQLFGQLFLVGTVLKMLISLSILLVYLYRFRPASKLFVLPFLLIYLCFTVYEVYFMDKLGQKPAPPVAPEDDEDLPWLR